MIFMPFSWVVIFVFNMWTIIHLRRETGHFMALTSVKRLQLRLLLITATFLVLWVLMSIPLYANNRTFALEICVKASCPPFMMTQNKSLTIIEMTKRRFHHLQLPL